MPQCRTRPISMDIFFTRPQFRNGYEQAAKASEAGAVAPWPTTEYDKLAMRDQALYEYGRLFATCTKGKFRNLFPATAKKLRGKGDLYQVMLNNWKIYHDDIV